MTSLFMSRIKMFLNNYNFSVLNTNLFVRIFCVSIFIGHLLSYFESANELFCIYPGKLFPPNFTIWTVVTYCFFEPHIWLLICNIIVVFMYGKVVEPLWGSLEMVRFYAIVSTFVAIFTVCFYFIEYLFTTSTDLLFKNPVNGMSGYAAGLTVVFKQTMGDQILVSNQFIKIRNKHIPVIATCLVLMARIIDIVPPPHLVLFAFGLIVSWVYLRFYQKHKDGTKGDSAEGFSFASFFPDLVSPYVGVLSNTVFALLVKVKICSSSQRKFELKPPVMNLTLSGTDIHDAERRRRLALKALNERLNKVSNLPWPNMEENLDEDHQEQVDPKPKQPDGGKSVIINVHETPVGQPPLP